MPGEGEDFGAEAFVDRGEERGASEGGGKVKLVAKVSLVIAVSIVLVDCRDPTVEDSTAVEELR